jgi:hypothetical protein
MARRSGGIITVSSSERVEATVSDFLLRDVDPSVFALLKKRAEGNGRSLQVEIQTILRESVKMSREEWVAMARGWQEETKGRHVTDTTELIREDRDRWNDPWS